ncbi:MAG: sel1 repeat family protein [Deltaproteobacteria bacterium]|nr:sel1 repeat family protein [Deltaproteobacteria bacterium]
MRAFLSVIVAVWPSAATAQVFGLSGVPSDLASLGSECADGRAAACRALAARYATDSDLPADRDVARQFLEAVCDELGYVAHSASFAVFRAAQRRARPCYRTLSGLLRRGCDSSRAWDCVRLASMVRYGAERPRDLRRARSLLESVCQSEAAGAARGSACEQLGELYEGGEGVRRGPARALTLYERACADLPGSCARLGALHEAGRLGPRNLDAARRCYRRACHAGSTSACGALRAIEER